VLVIGWNRKVGPLLASLEDSMPPGSKVDLYANEPTELRLESLNALETSLGAKFENLTISHYEVSDAVVSSYLEVAKMGHHDFDSIFALADDEEAHEGTGFCDERSIAVLAQMQRINRERATTGLQFKPFDPVVEICEDCSEEQLAILGITNVINSGAMRGQALAGVTENAKLNSIFVTLMSSVELDIACLETLWPAGKKFPRRVNFATACYEISLEHQCVLVGWSEGVGANRKWIVNPEDKLQTRLWEKHDAVVVIINKGAHCAASKSRKVAFERKISVAGIMKTKTPPFNK